MDQVMAETPVVDSNNITAKAKRPLLPVTVSKPIPYTFDLGNLLCTDANPLPPSHCLAESDIQSAARDCAQVLINQLLSTCPINRSSDGSSVTLQLPSPTTPLPREKPVPKEKVLTKWEEFAKKKGISGKKKDTDLVYDDTKGDWVRKWGRGGKNKEAENEWLVEVDEKKVADKLRKGDSINEYDPRAASRAERKERVRRQQRKARANASRSV